MDVIKYCSGGVVNDKGSALGQDQEVAGVHQEGLVVLDVLLTSLHLHLGLEEP